MGHQAYQLLISHTLLIVRICTAISNVWYNWCSILASNVTRHDHITQGSTVHFLRGVEGFQRPSYCSIWERPCAHGCKFGRSQLLVSSLGVTTGVDWLDTANLMKQIYVLSNKTIFVKIGRRVSESILIQAKFPSKFEVSSMSLQLWGADKNECHRSKELGSSTRKWHGKIVSCHKA